MPKRAAPPSIKDDNTQVSGKADVVSPQLDAAPAKNSPMMAQYLEIKAGNPGSLLFYRMGDFYELFFDDAEVAARALGIVLTKRGKHQGDDIPMCGVPVERAQEYLHRLISLGHRVAVCEQIEDPAEARKRGGKSVVRREVKRLVTPGTITEDTLLDPSRANRLLAIARAARSDGQWSYGLAALDISTGEFLVSEAPEAALEAEIARIEPAEIIVPDALMDSPGLVRLCRETKAPLTPLGRQSGEGSSAERRILDYFGLATLDGLGALSRAEIAAAAAALFYVERTQFSARPSLNLPARLSRETHMAIDAATRANLELTRTLTGAREGSLIGAIDKTVTAAGGRLLAERLAAPLTDIGQIARRQTAVAFFIDEPGLRGEVRKALKAAPDLMRAISRLALDRGGPRDLAALRDGFAAAFGVAQALDGAAALPEELREASAAGSSLDASVMARLGEALADALPLNRRDGGFIRPGFDGALDECRALRDETRKVIAALQARYCELADTRQLKLKHNHFLGHFIEVPQAQGEKLLRPPFDATFIHRQTMADAMRFSTRDLAELEVKISSAADEAMSRELAIFADLAALLLAAKASVKRAAEGLAAIDVAASLAELAADCDWTRPEVDASLAFAIEGGRHPVVEAALRTSGQAFVANDCALSGVAGKGGRIAIVTGPNMAGKSTYLRQNALIAVLAQMGAFVPARRAHIGVVDRLFSRVGAADDLARGRSTFMVEMVETAAILNSARERSLVILDEIGRGTATFDGLSIAWAVMEHLHESNRSRALFATHFHELTQLAKRLERIDNLTVRVTDWNGDVVFLHEIIPGAADQSYGVQVAKLAGLPTQVVARARHLLAEFEASDRSRQSDRLVADLPLFSAASAPKTAYDNEAQHETKARDRTSDALGVAIDAIDPDELSPKSALEQLYRLKRLRATQH
ncbi:DNA mismatch repair protein MutS [Methylocella tundrae]|uniref:DNA mismatch repair protein MutS n=1 Tax=Methylocella tundrae TaxID=227605 RepID=A0A8B6M221_METTU|nr:DNA mismatch repair protein MutS [Methylocella tundrae]VTZ48212.1 DNA mismatch repair protein MutS [Methylocella tundrae]